VSPLIVVQVDRPGAISGPVAIALALAAGHRRFALALVAQDARGRAADAAADQVLCARLRPHRALVGTWCRGVAYVEAPGALPADARDLQEAALLWGTHVRCFARLPDAVAWLGERLER
jgi:hypothetical protein